MRRSSDAAIVAFHKPRLNGRLTRRTIRSRALGVRKPYFVYEPPDLGKTPAALVYLFRGHQREWANPHEDGSRVQSTAIEDIDRMITAGRIRPVIAVLPSLSSSDNHVHSLGIDMVGSWTKSVRGLGTGQFWSFITRELIPKTERRFGKFVDRRLAVGFSLGGFAVAQLGSQLPGYLDHIGIYDGTLSWPRHRDPRLTTRSKKDEIFYRSQMFDAAFGSPRNEEAMVRWNPAEAIARATFHQLHLMRMSTYWMASAPDDGLFGNRDRTRAYAKLLKERGVPLGFPSTIFDAEAEHNWHWTDRFLVRFLTAVHAASPVQTLRRGRDEPLPSP